MYQALNATSKTLREYLRAQIMADPFLSGPASPWTLRGMSVSLSTPEEMDQNGVEGISLWLYRVIRDEERLNEPPQRVSLTEFRPPPLPMRLHYLVTPVTTRSKAGDPDTEQYLLGKVLQAFHSKPTLRGADLRGELTGSAAELGVRLETLNLDEIARVWDALEASYQLSVSYEVSAVNVDSALEPEAVSLVEVVMPEIGLMVD